MDAEVADQPVPAALARRHRVATEQFWHDWTAAEVSAKLTGIPIVVWLRRYGFAALPGVTTGHLHDLVVSVGQLPVNECARCTTPVLASGAPAAANR